MAVAPDDQRLFGRLQATMEGLVDSHREFREEGRRRDNKLDMIGDHLSRMEDKFRLQAEAAKNQISDMKHQHSNDLQKVMGRVDLIDLHLKKLELQGSEQSDETKKIAKAQDSMGRDMEKLQVDTKALQISVKPFVRVRQALIAWVSATASVIAFLFLLLHPVWDAAVEHFLKSIGWK